MSKIEYDKGAVGCKMKSGEWECRKCSNRLINKRLSREWECSKCIKESGATQMQNTEYRIWNRE